jgi:hypothetical protein
VNGDPLKYLDRGHFGDVESGVVVVVGSVRHENLSSGMRERAFTAILMEVSG